MAKLAVGEPQGAAESARRRGSAPSQLDRIDLEAWAQKLLNRHPAVGLAVGIVRDGQLESFYGHGFADVATGTPITPDTVFRIGSITKTFTTIAILQLWENGQVNLDAPASDYLRAYRLTPAKPAFRRATIRHLLTHTAGLPETRRTSDVWKQLFGETVKLGERVPSLAEFYGGSIPITADPGSSFVYTDHDFATLGQVVEDVSGQPLASYLREHVFEPLGMFDTDLVRSDRMAPRLATGYTLGSRGAKPIADYDLITVAGGGAYSTPADMARYVAALLSPGSTGHGSVLHPQTVATMFGPHYQPDRRLPGVGLAFGRYDFDGHSVVEHGGVMPGFNSQIFLAPDQGVGVMAFTNGARLAMLWLMTELGQLLRELIGAPVDAVRSDVPHHPEVWPDLCGWYEPSARLTDVRARAILGLGVEVFVRRGLPTLRILSPIRAMYRGFELHPDDPTDPYAFRIDLSEWGIGTARVLFSREAGQGTMCIHTDIAPYTVRKRPQERNPRSWAIGGLGAVAVALALISTWRRRHGAAR